MAFPAAAPLCGGGGEAALPLSAAPAPDCDRLCIRITGRLGLTDGSKDPLSVEKQLRAVLPPEESSDFCHRMVLFGRDRCTARKANCDGCPLRADCDFGKAQSKKA